MKKNIIAIVLAVILISGAALGSLIWFADVEVGIEYERPSKTEGIEIYMSESEVEPYEWYEVEVGQTHELNANFSEQDPWIMYHQYVNVTSPEDVNVTIDINTPSEYLGFKVIEGIVEPNEEYDEDTTWDDVTIEDADGYYTVIYHIRNFCVEYEDVEWNFHVN